MNLTFKKEKKFKIYKIIRKSKKLYLFLIGINEKNFLVNKSYTNTPWIHFNNKNFNFYKIVIRKKIEGIAVIIKFKSNTHLQFFYISRLFRSAGLGKNILKLLLPKKKFTTVHVPKKLTNKTIKFYLKNGFQKSNLREKNYLIKDWISKCINFDKKTFKEKVLLYRNLKVRK